MSRSIREMSGFAFVGMMVLAAAALGGLAALAATTAETQEGEGGAAAAGKSLVAEGAAVEKVATGYRFTEGPTADARGDVYFSDIPNNAILRFDVPEGKAEVAFRDTAGANGLMFDKDGKLVACSHGRRAVVKYDVESGEVDTLADQYDNKKFNSPNDLDIDAEGGIYFTDPRYGNRDDMELDVMGVYYHDEDGQIVRVAEDLVRPNGLILSLDGGTLYVSDADAKTIYAYAVNTDGTLRDRRVFAKVPDNHRRAADGMTIDEKGNVYGACTDGIRIWGKGGKLLEVIKVPETPSNCTFAGPDGRWLYITARTSLYRVKMTVGGRQR